MKEWQIKLSSGKCPHKYNEKCGKLKYRKKCVVENCPIKVEEPNENA
jgi:hypothetical protein